MVDWQSPTTIQNELGAYVKIVHVIDGIYIWEFICNIGFEYGLLRGRRLWRWTAAIYIACRLCTISQVVIDLVGLSLLHQINCKLWLIFYIFFRYVTTSIALSLYGLRTIAIYKRSKYIIFLTVAVVLANVIVWVRRVFKVNGVFVPEAQACMVLHTHVALLNNAVMLGSEVLFLLLMTGGIYYYNSGRRALKIMFREGLLWLTFAVLMQTVAVTCFILNFSDVTNMLFVPPAIIFTSIGATRMYRTLSDRQAGDLLDFWEASQDEATGEIRFRRQTQLVGHAGRQSDHSSSTTALPMTRRSRSQQQSEDRFVERFEAKDIVLNHESESMQDGSHSIVMEDDKSGSGWVHAR